MKLKLRSWHMSGGSRHRPGDVIDVSAEEAASIAALTGAELLAEPAASPSLPSPKTVESVESTEPKAPAAVTPTVFAPQPTKGMKR